MTNEMCGGVALKAAFLGGLCWLLACQGAAAWDRPYYRQAQNAFYQLSARGRNEIYIELMATGDFVEMASPDYDGRLYDATASFQDKHALPPSGVLTPETCMALRAEGGRIFNSWGMTFLDHPFADASLAVPSGLGLWATRTRRGVALENQRHTMSVAFAFFADGEASLASVFNNLTRTGPETYVTMQVLKPSFLAIAGVEAGRRTYSRYVVVNGGIAGFTVAWNPSVFPNADRIALIMANELYGRRMGGADMFAQLSGDDLGMTQAQREAQAAAQSQLQQQADQEAENRKRMQEAARQAAEEQARRIREADEARKAKAEADRLAAQERIRADHLAASKATADDALKDAAEFVKANHDDPRLLDHLQAIADLKAAANGSDPEVLDRGRAKMQAQLKSDPVYAGWEERQIAERRRAEERDLLDTMAALSVQKRFLIDQVASDPTGPNARKFLDLVKQVDAVDAAPALVAVQTLSGRIDAVIKDADLGQKYALARSEARKASEEGASSSATPRP